MKPLFWRIGAVAASVALICVVAGCSSSQGNGGTSENAISVDEFIDATSDIYNGSKKNWQCADVYTNENSTSIQVVSLGENGNALYCDEWHKNESGSLVSTDIEAIDSNYHYSEEFSSEAVSASLTDYARTQTTILYKAISESLYDPYSAQYESIECFYSENDSGIGHLVSRITVNAKNRLGGYTGAKTYYYDGDDLIERENKAGGFKEQIQEYDSAASQSQRTTPWAYFEFSTEDLQ